MVRCVKCMVRCEVHGEMCEVYSEMVAGGWVGPALIRVCGICRDLRYGSELVNSIRDIDGFLGGSGRIDKCL